MMMMMMVMVMIKTDDGQYRQADTIYSLNYRMALKSVYKTKKVWSKRAVN